MIPRFFIFGLSPISDSIFLPFTIRVIDIARAKRPNATIDIPITKSTVDMILYFLHRFIMLYPYKVINLYG